jgi:hypothetical protein
VTLLFKNKRELSPFIPEVVPLLTRITSDSHVADVAAVFESCPRLDEASAEY